MIKISRKEYEALSFEQVVTLAIEHLHKPTAYRGEVDFNSGAIHFFVNGKDWFPEGITKDNYLLKKNSIRKLLATCDYEATSKMSEEEAAKWVFDEEQSFIF